MTHSKTFKREDGSRVQIDIYFWLDRGNPVFDFQVSHCMPGKRKFISPVNSDDYTWRKLSLPERKAFNEAKYMELATPAEILATKLELWEKLKPE